MKRAQFDARVRLVAASMLGLSLLLVNYWWMVDGGLRDLGDVGNGWSSGWDSLGRLSGLVASVLLLAQVVLMSRLPILERAYGQDRLAYLHRIVGFTSFNLMLVHLATITLGYALGRWTQVPSTFWDLTVNYPGMLLALAGTFCLIMVAMTSVKAARRALRYESWHLLHLYAYLGVGLALPHQLWTGTIFTSSPIRTAFWWTAWAATAVLVLVTRLGRPVVVNLRHQLRVIEVASEGDGLWSVTMGGRRLDRLSAQPGQFFTWRFLAGAGWSRGHPYSLSAAPDGRSLRITVQGVGDGSLAIGALKPGTRVLIEGPYGRLSERPRTRSKVAFIGAGVGVTPLRALAEGLPYEPGNAVYIERCTDTPLFASEVNALSASRGLRVLRMPGRRRHDGSWFAHHAGQASDRAALLYWVDDIAERDVYVCGPVPWTDLVCATLRSVGLPGEQLHLENFAW